MIGAKIKHKIAPQTPTITEEKVENAKHPAFIQTINEKLSN